MNRRIHLATRLFLTQSLIVFSGALTLVLAAIAVAPGLFRQRVGRAMGPGMMALELDRSFGSALSTSTPGAASVTVAAPKFENPASASVLSDAATAITLSNWVSYDAG